MTALEFSKLAIQNNINSQQINETAAKELAQFISGSMVYQLYELLAANDFEMKAVKEHLETLYDTQNHFGFIYFIVLLSEAVELYLSDQFFNMATDNALVPILSAAFIEDWLDFHEDYEDLI